MSKAGRAVMPSSRPGTVTFRALSSELRVLAHPHLPPPLAWGSRVQLPALLPQASRAGVWLARQTPLHSLAGPTS